MIEILSNQFLINFIHKIHKNNYILNVSFPQDDSTDAIFCARTTCDISNRFVLKFQLPVIFFEFWDRSSVVMSLKNSYSKFDKQIQCNKGVVFLEERYGIRYWHRNCTRMRYFSSKNTVPLWSWISLRNLVHEFFSLMKREVRF